MAKLKKGLSFLLCLILIQLTSCKTAHQIPFEEATILVNIKDHATNKTIQGVEIFFIHNDEAMQFGQTDVNGNCLLNVKTKSGSLKCQKIGYETLLVSDLNLKSHKKHHFSFKMNLLTY